MNWLDRLLAEPDKARRIDPTLEILCAGLPPDDAHGLREERAALMEFAGCLSRVEAERLAGLGGRRIIAA